MAATLTTKLDAVNMALESIWEAPVSTLEVSGLASVATAVRLLDDLTVSVLSRGWAFNTEWDFVITKDSDGKMPIPLNTLRIDTSGSDQNVDVVQRGQYLYDREHHTFTFTQASLKCKLITLIQFEDLPQTAREYIARVTARTFVSKWLSQPLGAPGVEETLALTNLEEQEADDSDLNMFTDSNSVAQTLQRW